MIVDILVVDDTPDNLRLLMQILQEEGYKVRPASDGIHALATARVDPPALILLDIVMPGMDGYQVCEQLKADTRTRHIPVLFLSALEELFDKMKAFSLGGVDYITKPFQAEEVLARIKTHLTLRKLQQRLEDLVEERTAYLQHEIRERQRVEEHLRISEQQYRFLVEQVTDGIAIVQADRFVFVNNMLASLLRYPPDQLIGSRPESLSRALQQLPDATFHQACAAQQEFPLVQDGGERWFEEQHSQIQWQGQPARLIVLRDVTERKRRETELQEERKRLRRENIRLRSAMKERYKFGGIIGKSLAMQEVYEIIMQASTTDANVVISGESGTGKDLIARTIHQFSQRRKYPFVPVNCGSIQETVFEREFFGHRKGAFTGAIKDHPGFFDAAHQGTLFLDEVGELNLAMQIKLLRAIEEKGYTPVGDQHVKHADIRIIAATNRNLKELVKQGLMRQDFFYRINVIPITIPPLRAHKEDIPLLIEYFLRQYAGDNSVPRLPGRILDILSTHDWPGNIRQLQNVLQRYLTLKRLDFDDIHDIEDEETTTLADLENQGLQTILEDFEKRVLLKSLERNQGHKGKTAEMLQIDPKTLYRRLKKYQLSEK